MIFGASVAVVAFFGAWWIWPDDLTDKPLSHMSLRDMFRLGMSGVCGLAGIFSLIGAVKDAWPRFR